MESDGLFDDVVKVRRFAGALFAVRRKGARFEVRGSWCEPKVRGAQQCGYVPDSGVGL